ncbi:LysR family transcriptional regulator [Microscilla marina]|uniref:LysR family transcriptional regulatory protein, putative n=1 Tax=Microscilla marina ATCC 23134 TaxID=313606 RepID=A1ZLC0_MICM2|nr:LysR family transcriptional regulator [Microscilla marina]EAY28674.1 LysR family transcriptional regulatory protein, putative [Microscilla marina ATCC 23134]
MIEFKQLTVFISVAESLSFSKAAQSLSITQPTVSKHIKTLEDELGVALFVRNQKQLSLTFEGKVFLEEARKILVTSEKARNVVKSEPRPQEIKIGFVPLAMLTFLPQFISAMKTTLPNVNIQIQTFHSNLELLEQFHQGNLDVAFYYQTYPQDNMQSLMVYEDDIVVIQPTNSEYARVKEITPAHAPFLRYILPPRESNPYLMDMFFNMCKFLKFEPEIAFYMRPHQARLSLVSEGLGVMMDSESLKKLHTPNIVFTPLHKNVRSKARIFMGYKPEHKHQDIIQHFVGYFDQTT